jgi:excinuclease ABC subunit C
MIHHLAEKVHRVSIGPGVYLMKDDRDKVIYVGKAMNLRKRLASYFISASPKDIKTGVLISNIIDFETILTATEKEALILESNLIKQYRPRYNVILKDDKRYPSLYLDLKKPFPNIAVVRKIKKDGGLYFGPYSSGQAVKETIKIINKTFKMRKCKTRTPPKRTRPCLNFQMGACHGPCCGNISEADYREIVNEVVLFLKGKTPDLIRKMRSDMTASAETHDYEKAAEIRDRIFSLERTLEKQVAATTDFMDRDVLALASEGTSVITLLTIRGGFLRGTRTFYFDQTLASESELMESFIRQYYENLPFIPPEILVSIPLGSSLILEEFLGHIKGKKVSIRVPQRGEKKRLVEMATSNAITSLTDRKTTDAAMDVLLHRLQKRMGLRRFPRHIECFDNSNIMGASPVAAMVAFKYGKPEKSLYRKYNIRDVEGPDDYASMKEILHRRFRDAQSPESLPDLLLVDGGRGQLNIAVEVLRELALTDVFDIAAIAKKDEKKGEFSDKVYKPHRANPINFGNEQDLLLFLQRIRDESHRFAVTFHRQKRKASFIESELDGIPGIGKTRKQLLLKYFGSFKKIRAASLEELSKLPGMDIKTAEAVLRHFKPDED